MTERNSSQQQSYAEAVARNFVREGKDITSKQSQFNTSPTLRENSTEEVSPRAENKVEENLFTLDDKWVTNEKNKRKCKR